MVSLFDHTIDLVKCLKISCATLECELFWAKANRDHGSQEKLLPLTETI